MNLNNISLPYPVLGISDDITPTLPDNSVEVDLQDNFKSFTFDISLTFHNKDIQQLISDGKAEYTCEYECARTMLRRCEKSQEPHFHVEISRRSLNGRITFSCYVSVKEAIKNYSNKGFNEDYDGATFDMEPGDILVAFPLFHYDADIKYDKLQAAGSFMQIRESDLHDEVFFDISGDKIEILLPPPLYNLYCNPMVKGAAAIIHSSLVMNALTYALMHIKPDGEENRLWGRTINYRLKNEEGYSLSDLDEPSNIPCLAQRLLKDPYKRLFNDILTRSSNPLSEEN